MDQIGILPQFTGTLVRDGFSSYARFGRRRHSLCDAHLLRDLMFVEELASAQKVWTTALAVASAVLGGSLGAGVIIPPFPSPGLTTLRVRLR